MQKFKRRSKGLETMNTPGIGGGEGCSWTHVDVTRGCPRFGVLVRGDSRQLGELSFFGGKLTLQVGSFRLWRCVTKNLLFFFFFTISGTAPAI